MRRVGPAFGQGGSNHLQSVDSGRADARQMSPAVSTPPVPRPALVAGGSGRVAIETRTPITPRLRPIRSTDRY
jgi:hypothetical protein